MKKPPVVRAAFMRRLNSEISLIVPGNVLFGQVDRFGFDRKRGARRLVRAIIHKSAQGPQPGFVAPPARDGSAIDRLPGLPLAWGLYRPRIAFGPQARIVPC